jgi:FkbM family methyltransferase
VIRGRWFSRQRERSGLRSYSQCGEDLIAHFLLDVILGIREPAYLDIGAHDPVTYNNTYFFYERGSAGILIEPNSMYHERYRRLRPRDLIIRAGVSATSGESMYYRFDADALNTFSRSDAVAVQGMGHVLLAEETLPLRSISDVLSQAGSKRLDLVSLDTEGHDEAILSAWDFSFGRPAVFCVETLEYSRDGSSGRKRVDVFSTMKRNGYQVYADTYINTIFVDMDRWSGTGILGQVPASGGEDDP